MARLALEKDVEIVGAIARSPEKIGRDLGEVANLGLQTGVTVEDDARQVFESRAVDIALFATVSPIDDVFDQYRICIENGSNAISICEEWLYPWLQSPQIAKELDRLAREHGVTVTGEAIKMATGPGGLSSEGSPRAGSSASPTSTS
jgi:4-hydroxy-tetrahydrodipicolinate reductase